jgi:hypothetical protein
MSRIFLLTFQTAALKKGSSGAHHAEMLPEVCSNSCVPFEHFYEPKNGFADHSTLCQFFQFADELLPKNECTDPFLV